MPRSAGAPLKMNNDRQHNILRGLCIKAGGICWAALLPDTGEMSHHWELPQTSNKLPKKPAHAITHTNGREPSTAITQAMRASSATVQDERLGAPHRCGSDLVRKTPANLSHHGGLIPLRSTFALPGYPMSRAGSHCQSTLRIAAVLSHKRGPVTANGMALEPNVAEQVTTAGTCEEVSANSHKRRVPAAASLCPPSTNQERDRIHRIRNACETG